MVLLTVVCFQLIHERDHSNRQHDVFHALPPLFLGERPGSTHLTGLGPASRQAWVQKDTLPLKIPIFRCMQLPAGTTRVGAWHRSHFTGSQVLTWYKKDGGVPRSYQDSNRILDHS
jgi:hypothetical protein